MKLDVKFEQQPAHFDVHFRQRDTVGSGTNIYPGPYEIEPSEEEQVLHTNRMVMRRDVTIHATPFTGKIYSATTEEWNSTPTLIGEEGALYIYTDYNTVTEEGVTRFVPGFKVGDGAAFLIDTPFTDKVMVDHMSDEVIHVSQSDRDFWNNKVSAFYLNEALVLTTE